MVTIRAGAAGIAEGNYTSWIHKWNWSVPDGGASNDVAFYIDDANDVFYLWWQAQNSPYKYRFGAYNIVDHSTIFESPAATHYPSNEPYVAGAGDIGFLLGCHSLPYSILRSHQTYILLSRWDATYMYHTLEVWRAGIKLWTRDIRADTGEAYGEAQPSEISLTGKYIMIFEGYETNKLMLYEGT